VNIMGMDRNNYQIGIYLEKALQYKNLTIKELSDLSGIEITMLRKFLINEKSPSLTTINKISNALNMDPEYFTSDSYSKDGNIKATILSNDLILHIDKNNEKDLKKAFRAMNRMMNQIFNSTNLEGKKEIIDSLYLYMVTVLTEIASTNKNPNKDPWKHLYSENSLLHDMFGINEKDIAKITSIYDKVLKQSIADDDKDQK
uniref:helix-turn-helix domain-containing protein n=1 Tax=Holdemanella biformis TaxID=1735 RepID=UPI0022E5E344